MITKEITIKITSLFGTDGIRGVFGEQPLDPENLKKISKALALFLIKKNNDKKDKKPDQKNKKNTRKIKVIIGRDTRESGKIIQETFIKELNKAGINTYSTGIISTPGLAVLTKDLDYDVGLMITASHNPSEYNGIKFFYNNGKKFSSKDERIIEEYFYENKESEKIKKELKKSCQEQTLGINENVEHELNHYLNKITTSRLNNLKIVLDCANGAAHEIAPKALKKLGVEVIVIGNNPDGNNINQDCGSQYPNKLKEKVISEKADIGIALDGDADRIIVVDEQGKEVNGDKIIAIIANYLNKKNNLRNKGVVVTHYSNLGLDEAINNLGIKVKRVDNGDIIVREHMDLEDYNVGGERSGHIILSDYSPTGDGLITGIKLLEIMHEENKPISELSSFVKEWPQKLESIKVKEKKPLSEIEGLKELEEKLLKKMNKQGRIYLRYSGTEPKLRVMIECKNQELLEEVSHKIMEKLKEEL